jgi:hypothetical protein
MKKLLLWITLILSFIALFYAIYLRWPTILLLLDLGLLVTIINKLLDNKDEKA